MKPTPAQIKTLRQAAKIVLACGESTNNYLLIDTVSPELVSLADRLEKILNNS